MPPKKAADQKASKKEVQKKQKQVRPTSVTECRLPARAERTCLGAGMPSACCYHAAGMGVFGFCFCVVLRQGACY